MLAVNLQRDMGQSGRIVASSSPAGSATWAGTHQVHEKFRRLRSSISAGYPSHLCVAVTSIRRPGASSWVTSNLAFAFAEREESSLLASASGERPQAGLLAIERGVDRGGFAIRSTQQLHIGLVEWREEGQPEHASNAALTLVIPKIRDMARVVLIDCAPIAESSQCLELADCTDGVLLVLDSSRDSRAEIQRQASAMRAAGLRLLGAVLHNRERELPSVIEGML